MKWMMLFCTAPLIIFLLIQGGGKPSWLTWILVGGFVFVHILVMAKGYSQHNKQNAPNTSDAESVEKSETKDEQKHGGCCH